MTSPPRETGSWSGTRRSFPRRIARAILHRDRACQLAWEGCTTDATEADHIVGHADALAAGWPIEDIDDPANGQGVCRNCHRLKTRMEIARGLDRARTQGPPRPNRQRPAAQHPGLIKPEPSTDRLSHQRQTSAQPADAPPTLATATPGWGGTPDP